jgi:adenosylmethionine-8-amino-7-oxononanoate aminotransferase
VLPPGRTAEASRWRAADLGRRALKSFAASSKAAEIGSEDPCAEYALIVFPKNEILFGKSERYRRIWHASTSFDTAHGMDQSFRITGIASEKRKTMSTTPRPGFGGPQDFFYSVRNTASLPMITRGEGIYLVDDAGNRYLDVVSGAFTANLGQGNKRVLQAMYDQGVELSYSYVRVSRHRPNIELTRRIGELAGPGFERVHLSSGGSEAVEMAIKFLRQYAFANGETKRTRVITLMPSYHGGTLATLGWTGDEDIPAVWHDMTVPSEKIPAPLSYRPSTGTTSEDGARASVAALDRTIREIGPETVLAFMFEPVGGQSTGANVPHPAFFEGVAEVCRRHGVFIVFDEVMAAVRSGSFLAAHRHPDCRPHVVVTAKGIGAGYTPLGVVLAPAAMVDDLSERTGFNLSHTYNANPIACAAGIAVIDEVVERGLVDAARETGAYLRERLEELKAASPIVGDVRGEGLLLAVEYVRDKAKKTVFPNEVFASDRIRQIGLSHGLLLYSRRQNGGRFGEWSIVSPPLVITRDEVDELVDRLAATLADFTDEMTRAGVAISG